MPSRTLLLTAVTLTLTACATAPTHVPGEVPRDANGRPIWSMIEPTAAPTR
ncbi:hypothetical protein ACFOMD_13500 [Sphingoaurantiacus capsulatus]|uniref:Lipoprotein n=1 Tax=Sphingoaurantiacus capsulatus TaxID=1771310 RepID=A0ABV7XBP8_9SPHN